jgi:hypothetical protein
VGTQWERSHEVLAHIPRTGHKMNKYGCLGGKIGIGKNVVQETFVAKEGVDWVLKELQDEKMCCYLPSPDGKVKALYSITREQVINLMDKFLKAEVIVRASEAEEDEGRDGNNEDSDDEVPIRRDRALVIQQQPFLDDERLYK